MSGYTSGKTHSDPRPWLSETSGLRYRQEPDDGFGPYSHTPRPEYDHHNPILVGFREELPIPYDDTLAAVVDWWLAGIDADERGDYIRASGEHVFMLIEIAQGENPEGYGHAAAWSIEVERNKQAAEWRDHARRVLIKLAALTTTPNGVTD